MKTYKDLFSAQAADYAKFRPTYPRELFQWLASQTREHEAAWDCGTGNGQAARVLADFFKRVFATDPSEKQLQAAEMKPNVVYSVGSAEASGLADRSVDLVTVAQAYHWFDHPRFFDEIRRVGRPGALVAVWSYGLARISPEVDAVVMRLYDGILGSYWEKERHHVMEGYRGLPFDFPRLEVPQFEMRTEWTLEALVGYLGTWSALQTRLKATGQDPLELVFQELQEAWGETGARPVVWDLTVLAGRL